MGGVADLGADTYVDSLIRETWRNSGRFLFGLGEQDGKLLSGGHGNITTVVAREKSLKVSVPQTYVGFSCTHLALQVKEEDCRRHDVRKPSKGMKKIRMEVNERVRVRVMRVIMK